MQYVVQARYLFELMLGLSVAQSKLAASVGAGSEDLADYIYRKCMAFTAGDFDDMLVG